MGVAKAKRYAMTCETFDAERAESLGLVDEVCATGSLDEAAEPLLEALLRAAPGAVAATKQRSLQLANQIIDDKLARSLAEEHAGKRLSEEAGEGLRSFVERSPVPWHGSD
jgi:methylglutaconyl-CoA hydratase